MLISLTLALMDEPSVPPQPPPLPANLPRPVDDGAAAHLEGEVIPDLTLRSTHGQDVNLADLAADALVVYVFPKMGRPDDADPAGWSETPGAYGCTQQSCAFRDRYRQFSDVDYSVVGISVQPPEEQSEAAKRLHLAFPLLADPERHLGEALKLPTLSIAGMTFYNRLTLVAREGSIVKVFYPVFPPNENAEEVLSWIRSGAGAN